MKNEFLNFSSKTIKNLGAIQNVTSEVYIVKTCCAKYEKF